MTPICAFNYWRERRRLARVPSCGCPVECIHGHHRLLVPWEKVDRLIAAGNGLADALDLRDPAERSMSEVLTEWDQARYALAPEQEAVRRGI